MPWIVDTCLVIDVLDNDPLFGLSSARFLDNKAAEGLALCPVSYVELAPAFDGQEALIQSFLRGINVDFSLDWTWQNTEDAFLAWHRHVSLKRNGKIQRRPIADIQIGAFASRCSGLLTRNPDDFQPFFPELAIETP